MSLTLASPSFRSAAAPALPLDEWMRRKGVDNHALADVLEVHPSTASRLRRGLHRPSAELSAKLRELTAGQVDLKAGRAGLKRDAGPASPDQPPLKGQTVPMPGGAPAAQARRETALFHLAFDFVCSLCDSATMPADGTRVGFGVGWVELDTLDRRIAASRAIVQGADGAGVPMLRARIRGYAFPPVLSGGAGATGRAAGPALPPPPGS